MKTRLICATVVMLAVLAAIVVVCDIADSAWPLVAVPFCYFAIPFAKDIKCGCHSLPTAFVFKVSKAPEPEQPSENHEVEQKDSGEEVQPAEN